MAGHHAHLATAIICVPPKALRKRLSTTSNNTTSIELDCSLGGQLIAKVDRLSARLKCCAA
jgi:hypothetical protein